MRDLQKGGSLFHSEGVICGSVGRSERRGRRESRALKIRIEAAIQSRNDAFVPFGCLRVDRDARMMKALCEKADCFRWLEYSSSVRTEPI